MERRRRGRRRRAEKKKRKNGGAVSDVKGRARNAPLVPLTCLSRTNSSSKMSPTASTYKVVTGGLLSSGTKRAEGGLEELAVINCVEAERVKGGGSGHQYG